MSAEHFNIFNKAEESYFTAGRQLANIAAVKPVAPAIVYISPEGNESVTSWRELESLSNRMAWYLMDQGIGPGSFVIAALTNTPSHVALAFAIWKTGACYVPVSNRTPKRNMLEIAGASLPPWW